MLDLRLQSLRLDPFFKRIENLQFSLLLRISKEFYSSQVTMIAKILIVVLVSSCSRAKDFSPTSFKATFPQTKAIEIKSCLLNCGIKSNQIIIRDELDTLEDYEYLNYQWSIFYPVVYPMMFVLPENSSQVQNTVYCSRLSNTRAVPKGGGHSFAKYAYGDSNSVVMDFKNFNSTSVDNTSITANIEPGARIGPLAFQLQAANYIFSIGLCPTVGIGLSLGGGYSTFSRKYGMIVDSLLEVELVTPSASIIVANNETNTDLFWAIRGAGAGAAFGVVTNYKFQLHPSPNKIISTYTYYPLTMFPEIVSGFMAFMKSDLFDEYSASFEIRMTYICVSTQEVISPNDFQNWKTEEILKVFPASANRTLYVENYSDLLSRISETALYIAPKGTKKSNPSTDFSKVYSYYEMPTVNKAKAFVTDKILDRTDILKLNKVVQEISNPYIFINFLPFGGAISNLKPSETAFVHRKPKSYKVTVHYLRPSYEPHQGNCATQDVLKLNEVNRNICEPITTDSADMASSLDFVYKFYNLTVELLKHDETYQNDLDEDLPDYLERYFGKNLQRLKDIKKKFDPENYFHNPQSIPPAGFKMSKI